MEHRGCDVRTFRQARRQGPLADRFGAGKHQRFGHARRLGEQQTLGCAQRFRGLVFVFIARPKGHDLRARLFAHAAFTGFGAAGRPRM